MIYWMIDDIDTCILILAIEWWGDIGRRPTCTVWYLWTTASRYPRNRVGCRPACRHVPRSRVLAEIDLHRSRCYICISDSPLLWKPSGVLRIILGHQDPLWLFLKSRSRATVTNSDQLPTTPLNYTSDSAVSARCGLREAVDPRCWGHTSSRAQSKRGL